MQRRIRQTAVRRAGNARTGEVKVIGAAGDEGELLYGIKLRRQLVHICRDTVTRCVERTVAAAPHKVAACISIGAGQTIGGRCGKALAVFYDDLDIRADAQSAAAQFAAAKVKDNGFQSVRAQRVRVQDFKDRVETEGLGGTRSIGAVPDAGRIEPSACTARLRTARSILSQRIYLPKVFDISVVLVQHLVPFVALWYAVLGIVRAYATTSHGRCTQRILHAAGGVGFAENQTCSIQILPAYRMRYSIVRHKQAMCIFVLLCIRRSSCHCGCELVGVHCPGIGKGNIMQCFVRQSAVRRAADACTGEVKVIRAAESEVELLYGRKPCRELGYDRWDTVARIVELTIAAKPHKVTAGIPVWASQAVTAGCGKALAAFHNDLNILGAIPQLAAAKVKDNSFQSVGAKRVRVQDFKDRAEADARIGGRSNAIVPAASRIVPANRTARFLSARSILSPRIHSIPVLDISAVLVQHRVPFVALGHAALGLIRACIVTSHRRCAQGIVHAAGDIVLAENQTFRI